MKNYVYLILICVIAFFYACDKTVDDSVLIRISNSTADDFKEVLTQGKSYGSVDASAITSYQRFNKAADLPFATLVDYNNDSIYVGAMFYDYPSSFLGDGKYTLKIYEDATTPAGFNCMYIEE